MTLKIYNNKKELVNIIDTEKTAYKKLLELLLNKYIAKNIDIKQVQYTYNYTDVQKITFILSNKWRYVFDNILTQQGYFDMFKF